MKYLKRFDTHSEYEQYIEGGGPDLPNVSTCNDQPSHVHYNPKQQPKTVSVTIPNCDFSWRTPLTNIPQLYELGLTDRPSEINFIIENGREFGGTEHMIYATPASEIPEDYLIYDTYDMLADWTYSNGKYILNPELDEETKTELLSMLWDEMFFPYLSEGYNLFIALMDNIIKPENEEYIQSGNIIRTTIEFVYK